MGRQRGLRRAAACAALLLLTLAACTDVPRDGEIATADSPAAGTTQSPEADSAGDAGEGESDGDFTVADPGPFRPPLRTPDVLITSTDPIPAGVQRRIRALKGVAAAMPMSVASLSSNGRTLTIAAVDLAAYRQFTPMETARADDVWKRLAGGEVAVDPAVGTKLEEPRGYLTLGTQDTAPQVHIGAYAPLSKRISAVLTKRRGEQIGMPADNALLVSTGRLTPSVLTGKMQRILGDSASLQVLALEFDVDVDQTAVLSGTSASDAVGSFRYTAHPSGRITPDPAWVAANIRTEEVPLLGQVTCHKVMLVQLRAALTEVVRQGLGPEIHPDEFAGCYYPRFIGYDPAKGLSLHSWGIAVDLNVPGNQRGTVGEMDRGVVAIFKKWGFAWGGDWNYTDPMHFELAAIVRPG